jgi:hypothetical protein
MTDALATTRCRYEATPRVLDADLQRMARGDRGCLGDVLAGLGGVSIIVFGVLASFEVVGWGYMMAGTLFLLVGFVLSAAAQVRSGPVRRKALMEGPLVLGRVVAGDPALYEPSDAVLPARVVFAPAPTQRYQRTARGNSQLQYRHPDQQRTAPHRRKFCARHDTHAKAVVAKPREHRRAALVQSRMCDCNWQPFRRGALYSG